MLNYPVVKTSVVRGLLRRHRLLENSQRLGVAASNAPHERTRARDPSDGDVVLGDLRLREESERLYTKLVSC